MGAVRRRPGRPQSPEPVSPPRAKCPGIGFTGWARMWPQDLCLPPPRGESARTPVPESGSLTIDIRTLRDRSRKRQAFNQILALMYLSSHEGCEWGTYPVIIDADSFPLSRSVSQSTGSCVDGQSVAASHRGSNQPTTSPMRSHQRPFVESLRVITEMGITLRARATR
jgi:hypothetical protein